MRLTKGKNLYLVGPMAVGKTTIGKMLAKELGLEFIDTDQEIERRAGADIPWIFDVEGEARFRERESRVLEDLTSLQGVLLSTGGGTVTSAENRALLCQRGTVVYLDTTVETQLKRTGKDKKRPLLQTDDPREVLIRLKEVRAPMYEEVADIKVFVGDRGSRRTVNQIIGDLKRVELIRD